MVAVVAALVVSIVGAFVCFVVEAFPVAEDAVVENILGAVAVVEMVSLDFFVDIAPLEQLSITLLLYYSVGSFSRSVFC